MPSAEQLKQFLLGVILPPLIGIAAAWIVASVHVLNLFGITEGQIVGELSQLATFAITAAFAWLTQHKILSATYTPAAKAAAGKPRA